MGRGRGGYTAQQKGGYRDSGGNKVKDQGTIFVAERYIEQGYEAVFRQKHDPEKTYDLTIKSSDDERFIKNIEVKAITSPNTSRMADAIKDGFEQLPDDGKGFVAIYLTQHSQNGAGIAFAKSGFEEALRKGNIKGHVEVWFKDRSVLTLR